MIGNVFQLLLPQSMTIKSLMRPVSYQVLNDRLVTVLHNRAGSSASIIRTVGSMPSFGWRSSGHIFSLVVGGWEYSELSVLAKRG